MIDGINLIQGGSRELISTVEFVLKTPLEKFWLLNTGLGILSARPVLRSIEHFNIGENWFFHKHTSMTPLRSICERLNS